jgi:hypothetical protein
MGKGIRGLGHAEGDLCGVNGFSSAFPWTEADRRASGDSRLSIEERYPNGHAQFANQYGQAVDALVAERYLLPKDGASLKAANASGMKGVQG